MSDSILRDKAKIFAKDLINFFKDKNISKTESVMVNQLIRSGTSIGANIYEAQYAQSKLDFISKFEIALKECFESEYWLELLFETEFLSDNEFKRLNNSCGAIRIMLISTCKTLKEN